MPRPPRSRRICFEPANRRFAPMDGPGGAAVLLTLDEWQTIRLMDYADCTHARCAKVMGVSRSTVTEIYAAARKKVARALIEGRPLEIQGGLVQVCTRQHPCGEGLCTLGEAEKGCAPKKEESKHA